jgi:VanZ family protein
MPDNRGFWRPYRLSAAAGVIVAALCFIQILSLPTATKIQRLLVDFGHVPIFALIVFTLLNLMRTGSRGSTRYPAPQDYLIAGLAVSVLAVASEALQLLDPGRVASLSDILRNGAGGALGLLLCAAYYRPTVEAVQRRARVALVLASAVLFACLLFPVAWTSAAYAHKRASWPSVLGAGYRLELPYAVGYGSDLQIARIPHEWRLDDRESALRLRMRDCEQCGILVLELSREWEGLTRLCLEITNPGNEPLLLSVQLGDAPMFFRSSVFNETAMAVAARTRVTRCLPLSSPERPAPPATGRHEYGSLALLTGADETLEYFIHRIWLQ